MRGYWTGYSYKGWMPSEGRYREFVSQADYRDAFEDSLQQEA